VGPFVEGFCYVPETLLTCGVPDVQGYWLAVVLDALYLEVHPDRAQVVALETVLAVSHQQAGLADSAVAHY
jgi:hypothetical protein